MSDAFKSIFFALALCFICGTLLITASRGLQDRQRKNMITDRRKNILKSVKLIEEDKDYSAETIDAMYLKYIQKVIVDESGKIISETTKKKLINTTIFPIYLYAKPDGPIESYIIPIDTKGVWGKIHGYLSIQNDGSTINGFTVYKHSETPGLGGEIEKNWFQKNFVGKKIVNRQGVFVAISIAKGKVEDNVTKERQKNYVDGISGATLTGKYLSKGLEEILKTYEPVSIRFRQNNFRKPTPVEKIGTKK